jgi:hypothetical protein
MAYTGGIYEAQVLGEITPKNSEHFNVLWEKGAIRERQEPNYLGMNPAIDQVKGWQPWNDVRTYQEEGGKEVYFPRDLAFEIEDQLVKEGFSADEVQKRLKYFTAVTSKGVTSLDFHHGVDAFFEFLGKDGKKVMKRITLDASIKRRKVKEGKFKTDWLIAPLEEQDEVDGMTENADRIVFLPDPSLEEEAYIGTVEKLGKRIANELLEMDELRREIRGGMPPLR